MGSSAAERSHLSGRLAGPGLALPSAQLERQQDDLIDAPLVLAGGGTFYRLEDFARRRLELVPDVTTAFQEERMARVDHHGRDLMLDHRLAADGRVERAHDHLSKTPTPRFILARQPRRLLAPLGLDCVVAADPLSLGGLGACRRHTR